MTFHELLGPVEAYYSAKVEKHGPTAEGVDWSSRASQELRFAQLMKIAEGESAYSLNDYGCGWGALLGFLREGPATVDYRGYDLSAAMIARAREAFGEGPGQRFTTREEDLEPADFTVASGIFNVSLGADHERWADYVRATLERLRATSRRGFAFNALSLYSDADRRRTDLHYADPLALFDHCKRTLGPRVALLHDYPLWEFTILVRLAP